MAVTVDGAVARDGLDPPGAPGGAGEPRAIGLPEPGPPPARPLRALLVGGGYSGGRFAGVVRYLEEHLPGWITLAGVCDLDVVKAVAVAGTLPVYGELGQALDELAPDLAIVSVNEYAHAAVLRRLATSSAELILCEKPLTATLAEAEDVATRLDGRGLHLNLVERFSPAVSELKAWQRRRELRTLRVEFFWGKHRIGDPRHSMGVLSEIIHPIDLTDYLFGIDNLRLREVSGLRSNYAPTTARLLDTVDLVADAGSYPLVGHSSFAWPRRIRMVTALLVDSDDRTYRVTLDFDVGEWDCDHLSIAEIDAHGGLRPLLRTDLSNACYPAPLHATFKVCRFVQAGLHAHHGLPDADEVVDLRQGLRLQRWLHALGVALDGRDVPDCDVRAEPSGAAR